jgi:alpha-galactosidase
MSIYDRKTFFVSFVLAFSWMVGGTGQDLLAQSVGAAVKPSPPELRRRILTPPAPATPRINGARIYGQRPGRPFLFTVPTTGTRPIEFSADDLPASLTIDKNTGQIGGTAPAAGEYLVTLHAKNNLGSDSKPLKIVIGETIALTPPMGWNSWNCWAKAVDQEKVLRSARAVVETGLVNHGWTYINIDDAWQAQRGGEFGGIQPNDKFPDMPGLCDEIHRLGLKAGIYSTPWKTSYAGFIGGSADNRAGNWEPPADPKVTGGRGPWSHAKYPFAKNDARQWATWGFDYLKYDWNPNDVQHVTEMADALRASGRDLVYSLSNSAPFDHAEDWARLANCWRTTGDIRDTWWSVSSIGFSQSRWVPYAGPGHWNDPDMLVVGYVGWGPRLHPTKLTPDEQYTHISLWSLLAAPLLLGNDLERMDEFTLSLLTNDEVLAVNQDPLGREANRVTQHGPTVTATAPGRPDRINKQQQKQIWARDLADGSKAVGLFNLGTEPTTVAVQWREIGVEGKQVVRDLWRQKDLGTFDGDFSATVEPHGVVFVKVITVASAP